MLKLNLDGRLVVFVDDLEGKVFHISLHLSVVEFAADQAFDIEYSYSCLIQTFLTWLRVIISHGADCSEKRSTTIMGLKVPSNSRPLVLFIKYYI